jgi:predicted transcriptional regulator
MTPPPYVHLKLDPVLRVRLDLQADRRLVSRSLIVRTALERYLETLEDETDRLELEALR